MALQNDPQVMGGNATLGGLDHFNLPPTVPDSGRFEFTDGPAILVLIVHAVVAGPIDSMRQ